MFTVVLINALKCLSYDGKCAESHFRYMCRCHKCLRNRCSVAATAYAGDGVVCCFRFLDKFSVAITR